jgi:hypothetical protein
LAPGAARVLGDFERLERADLGEPYRHFPWIGERLVVLAA